MTHYDDFIKIVKKEIRTQGYYRKKFPFLLWQMWGYKQKNKEFLNGLDQALFENDILVYTEAENVRDQKENWDWFNLKNNEAYITFVANKKSIIKSLPYRI